MLIYLYLFFILHILLCSINNSKLHSYQFSSHLRLLVPTVSKCQKGSPDCFTVSKESPDCFTVSKGISCSTVSKGISCSTVSKESPDCFTVSKGISCSTVSKESPDCFTVSKESPDCFTVSKESPDCFTVSKEIHVCFSVKISHIVSHSDKRDLISVHICSTVSNRIMYVFHSVKRNMSVT